MNTPSEEQLEVIDAKYINNSPIITIAGAGSGKTTTIVSKINKNIKIDNIDGKNICAISFTNKSAKELKERIINSVGSKGIDMKIGTFHSISLNILKQYFGYKYRILDQEDDKKFLKKIYDTFYKDILDEIKTEYKYKDDELYEFYMKKISTYKDIIGVISKAKNTGENIYTIILKRLFFKEEYKEILIPNEYIKFTEYLSNSEIYEKENIEIIKNSITGEEGEYDRIDVINYKLALKVIKIYEKEKNYNRYKTFDDILIDVVDGLITNESIRKKIDSDYKYIYVDEFQDVNFIQFQFITLINKDNNYLIVVGDSDQAIYSFRGCDKHYFNNFSTIFPKTRTFFLNDNYRSDGNIVEGANNAISYNEHRYNKRMNNIKDYKNEIIRLKEYYENEMYSNRIIPEINKLIEGGEELSEITILYRNNNNSYSIQKELIKNKIPFNVVGGINFFSKKYIKDIRSFLENLETISIIHLERVLGLIDKVGKKKIETILNKMSDIKEYKEKIYILSTIKETQSLYLILLDYLKNKDLDLAINNFINQILEKTIKKEKDINKQKEAEDDVNMFLNILVELREEGNELEDILEILAIDDSIKKDKKNRVTLSTIHRSKGLEWNNVFLIKAYEGIFPSVRVISNPGKDNFLLEEERNVFYVAITRARNKLFICSAEEEGFTSYYGNNNKGITISRFISELY